MVTGLTSDDQQVRASEIPKIVSRAAPKPRQPMLFWLWMARPVVNVGVCGARGSTKTTSYLALYYLSNRRDSLVKCVRKDDGGETIRYLRPLLENLQKTGEFPEPTRSTTPDLLSFRFEIEGASIKVRLIEYGGDLADPAVHSEFDKFKRELDSWMARCNGVLLFVDSHKHHTVQRDTLAAFWDGCQNRHNSSDTRLVFAKIDEVLATRPTPQDLKVHAISEILEKVPELSRICDDIDVANVPATIGTNVGWEFRESNFDGETEQPLEPAGLLEAFSETVEAAYRELLRRRRNAWRYVIRTAIGTAIAGVIAGVVLIGLCIWRTHELRDFVKDYETAVQASDDREEEMQGVMDECPTRDWPIVDWMIVRDLRCKVDFIRAFHEMYKVDLDLKSQDLGAHRHAAVLDFVKKHRPWLSECLEAVSKPDSTYKGLGSPSYPASECPLISVCIDILADTVDAYREDRRRYEIAKTIPIDCPSRYALKGQMLEGYAKRPGLKAQEAEDEAKETRVREKRDQEAFERVLESWDPRQVDGVLELIRQYETAPNHDSCMAVALQRTRDQLNTYRSTEQQWYVDILGISFSDEVFHIQDPPKPELLLEFSIGEESQSIDLSKGNRIHFEHRNDWYRASPNLRAGPFTLSYREAADNPLTIEIDVVKYFVIIDSLALDYSTSHVVKGHPFVGAHGEVKFGNFSLDLDNKVMALPPPPEWSDEAVERARR